MGYKIFFKWIFDNLESWNLISHIILLIFWLRYVVQKWVWNKTCLRMSPLRWDISQAPKIFIAREIMHKSRRHQIKRYWIVHYFKFLKSDIPNCFAYTSAPWYGTEMFLYIRRSYWSHLSNEIYTQQICV